MDTYLRNVCIYIYIYIYIYICVCVYLFTQNLYLYHRQFVAQVLDTTIQIYAEHNQT